MSKVRIIWNGSPSQLTNIKCYVLCGLLIWLIVPIFFMFWEYLKVKNRKYILSDEILEIEERVFNKKSTPIELYRVKDYIVHEPLLMRIFGLGNLELVTSDKTVNNIVLYAIKDPKSLKNGIRDLVEQRRDKKDVKEVDFR